MITLSCTVFDSIVSVFSYNSEEGLCLQDNKYPKEAINSGIESRLFYSSIEQLHLFSEANRTKYVAAATELDLNTPLVQDESTDPMKALFKRK